MKTNGRFTASLLTVALLVLLEHAIPAAAQLVGDAPPPTAQAPAANAAAAGSFLDRIAVNFSIEMPKVYYEYSRQMAIASHGRSEGLADSHAFD